MIRGALSQALDPALTPVDTQIPLKGGKQVTVGALEELFSLSVREGLDLVKNNVEPLERDLLDQLADADDALIEENFPRSRAHHVKLLQSSVRQYCSRLVKRSLCTRHGLCKDLNVFGAYERAMRDSRNLLDVRKQMKKLLHDDKNRFRASLVTTFGQPVAQRARDIALLTRAVQVKEHKVSAIRGRPPETVPYVVVDRHYVPVTFALFKALRDVVAGLHDASLPAEIFALLNGVKSVVSGHVVRDAEILEEDTVIELGGSGQTIEIIGGGFRFTESERI